MIDKAEEDDSVSSLGQAPNGPLKPKKDRKSKAQILLSLVKKIAGGSSGGRDGDSSGTTAEPHQRK